ncbi:hypothetical protein GCM10009534_43480 [Kribbella sandramycini]
MFEFTWLYALFLVLVVLAVIVLLRRLVKAVRSSNRRTDDVDWDSKVSRDHQARQWDGPARTRPESGEPDQPSEH